MQTNTSFGRKKLWVPVLLSLLAVTRTASATEGWVWDCGDGRGIRQILAAKCVSCHQSPTNYTAVNATGKGLAQWLDFTDPNVLRMASYYWPGHTKAEALILRATDGTMPPATNTTWAAPFTTAEIKQIQSYINNGYRDAPGTYLLATGGMLTLGCPAPAPAASCNIAFGSAANALAYQASPATWTTPPAGTTATPRDFFTARCTGCHSPGHSAQFLDLSDATTVRASASTLLTKFDETQLAGSPMPRSCGGATHDAAAADCAAALDSNDVVKKWLWWVQCTAGAL